MKLFISYARVDKPYCIQIVNTLDAHETWYDQRLHAGQNWWKEILRRLDWCEGFVYLLSPESIQSEYCRKEYELARKLGRHIFPVLIHADTKIPDDLSDLHYIDFSTGLNAETVKALLNSIYLAAHSQPPAPAEAAALTADSVKPPDIDPVAAIGAATEAMEKGQFDHAVFLLKRAQASGLKSRFINIDKLLAEAEKGLQRQTYLREAKREYDQIAPVVKLSMTRKLGCEAFEAFLKDFPDYDPDKLSELCGGGEKVAASAPPAQPTEPPPKPPSPNFNLPQLEWCDIPAGTVEITPSNVAGPQEPKQVNVAAFKISRYPITNAQYRVFLDDPNGYANPKWWQFSPEAQQWRERNPEAHPPAFRGDERPRERVNWYDAMAFCRWLSTRLDMSICLPDDTQWIRAAQGDSKRKYPWGDIYDKNRCNTRESEVKMTTFVMRYPDGVSPYGVYDMSGNVWEWCMDEQTTTESGDSVIENGAIPKRLVHGGSYISPHLRAEINFHYYLDPHSFHSTIGFRIVANGKPAPSVPSGSS